MPAAQANEARIRKEEADRHSASLSFAQHQVKEQNDELIKLRTEKVLNEKYEAKLAAVTSTAFESRLQSVEKLGEAKEKFFLENQQLERNMNYQVRITSCPAIRTAQVTCYDV